MHKHELKSPQARLLFVINFRASWYNDKIFGIIKKTLLAINIMASYEKLNSIKITKHKFSCLREIYSYLLTCYILRKINFRIP